MQRQFSISTPAQTVGLDSGGRADVVFTVANASGVPTRGMARIAALGATQSAWLVLAGDSEREFPAGAMHQFTVAVNVPAEVAGGRYTFRLDMLTGRKGGEELTESPIVTIDVPARASAAKKRSTSWLAYAALALVVVVAAGAYLMMREPAAEPVRHPPTTSAAVTPGPSTMGTPSSTTTSVVSASATSVISATSSEPIDTSVAVPNVISTAVARAEWELESAGLKSQRKEVIDNAADAGTVRKTTPRPGERVAPGSVVELEVVVHADLVSVPDVVGTTWESASANIEKVGLVAISQNTMDFTRTLGTVVAQSPAAGTDVKRGTKVTATVVANHW